MKWLLVVAIGGCGRGFFNPMPSPVDGAAIDVTLGLPISYVQSNSTEGTNTQLRVAFALGERAGDVEVIVVGWTGTQSITAIDDDRGTTFTSVIGPQDNGGTIQAIFISSPIDAVGPGQNQVSVGFDGLTSASLAILEYAGVDPNTPIDAVVGNVGGASPPTTTALTTTHANDLLVVAANSNASLSGSVSGFVQRVSNAEFLVEDHDVTSSGGYSADLPLEPGDWVIQLVALRGL